MVCYYDDDFDSNRNYITIANANIVIITSLVARLLIRAQMNTQIFGLIFVLLLFEYKSAATNYLFAI